MGLKSKTERIYVDSEFKKLLMHKKISYGEPTLASFTAKAARNPSLLQTKESKPIEKYKKRGNFYEPLF